MWAGDRRDRVLALKQRLMMDRLPDDPPKLRKLVRELHP
jgi:hypothetical protein